MIFLGDVHGRWEDLASLLARHDLREETIVQVGDFGVGFDEPAREWERLDALDAVLAERGLMLYAIRGNHDDPAPFADGRHDRSRLRLVADYTTLTIDGRRVLGIGGATSIDRAPRRWQGLGWWPEEAFLLRPERLDGAPEIVVTHNAPGFCPPWRPGALVAQFARYDPPLLDDLARERAALTTLYHHLDRTRLLLWVYGHFHAAFKHEHDQVTFHGLPELGLIRVTEFGVRG